MKNILIPFTVTALSIASISCNKPEGNTTTTTIEPVTESSAKPYPLDTCLVSEEKLGSMGDPVVINHEGQEIKFCCDACVPKFNSDPAKYLPKLENANDDT